MVLPNFLACIARLTSELDGVCVDDEVGQLPGYLAGFAGLGWLGHDLDLLDVVIEMPVQLRMALQPGLFTE